MPKKEQKTESVSSVTNKQMKKISSNAHESIKNIFVSSFESTIAKLESQAKNLPVDLRQELRNEFKRASETGKFVEIENKVEEVSDLLGKEIAPQVVSIAKSSGKIKELIADSQTEMNNAFRLITEKMELYKGEYNETKRKATRYSLIGAGIVIILLITNIALLLSK